MSATGASNRTVTLGDTTAVAVVAPGTVSVLCACGACLDGDDGDAVYRCDCGRQWIVEATAREVGE